MREYSAGNLNLLRGSGAASEDGALRDVEADGRTRSDNPNC